MADDLPILPAPARLAAPIADMSRRYIEYGLPWKYRPGTIARYMADASCEVAVAMDRGAVAGFVVAEFRDTHVHLVLLAVDRAHRRSGLGRRLVEWVEAMARTWGTFEVRLEVRVSNRGARRFYERLGYGVSTRLTGYYGGHETALRLSRDLATQSKPRGGSSGGRWSQLSPR